MTFIRRCQDSLHQTQPLKDIFRVKCGWNPTLGKNMQKEQDIRRKDAQTYWFKVWG